MSLFKLKDIIYLLDIPILLVGLIIIKRKHLCRIETSWREKLITAVILLAAGISLFSLSYSKADRETFAYDNNSIIKNLGVYYFHYYNAKDFFIETYIDNKALSNQEKATVDRYFSDKPVQTADFRSIAKGKNLIIVQTEALQQFVINRSINGKEITPNLNKLIRESLYMDNIYYQVAGGNTSDAEFLVNASMYPLKEGSVYHLYAENTYNTLPKALKAQGYSTYASHAFKPEFYNRNGMYKAIGFDQFISCDDFTLDDLVGWEGRSLSDASFFKQTLDKIDTSKPFYGFLITLSSHHPFKFFEDFTFDVGEYNKTYIGNYLKAANYADSCIGQFVDELKSRGLYEDTLLVVYGDHSAVPKHQAGELMKLLGVKYSELEWITKQKIPVIIHYPGLENGKVNSITGGQIDIFPTVANLMGIEAPFSLGKDLLNTKSGYAVLRNGSVLTDDIYYNNSLGTVYDIKTGNLLRKNTYKERIKQLQYNLTISDLIIKKNAFYYK